MTRKERTAVAKLLKILREKLENTFRIHDLWDAVNEVEKLVGIPIRIDVMTQAQISNLRRKWRAEDKKKKRKKRGR